MTAMTMGMMNLNAKELAFITSELPSTMKNRMPLAMENSSQKTLAKKFTTSANEFLYHHATEIVYHMKRAPRTKARSSYKRKLYT